MAYDYADDLADIVEAIAEYGGDVSYVTETGGSFNPVTGQATAGTASTTTLQAISTIYDKQEGLVADSVVLTNAKKLKIAGEVFRGVGETLTVDGELLNIIYKTTIAPNITFAILTVLIVSK